MTHIVPKRRYHKIDGWRGYNIPKLAIVGSSDTGTWDDSPCPTPEVLAEIRRFRRDLLKATGIRCTSAIGVSSNVFCAKRWVKVSAENFEAAAQFAIDWLEEHHEDTHYIHNAEQGQLGYQTKSQQLGSDLLGVLKTLSPPSENGATGQPAG